MIVVQVSVESKPENAERVEELLREVVDEALQAPGCLSYGWYRSPDIDREIFVYAEFESEDAFTRYRKGPVVKKIGEQVLPLLERRPSFKHLRATVMEQG